MDIGYVTHEDFLLHDNGPGHPERPDRLRAIWKALDEAKLTDTMKRIEPEPIDPAMLHHIHEARYVERVEATSKGDGRVRLDPDTTAVPASYGVARRASGGSVAAVDAVMAGRFKRVFCAHRPPGHHAERDRAMGFCLFNHVAVAADHLIRKHKLGRVAIVDFDVHHGNGTQHSFEERADVLFISIHEDPRYLYPGTGFAHETGKGAGEGFTLNVPMMPGATDALYQRAFEGSILPKLDAFKPQFLLISAGFDAAAEDPLAHIELTTEGFAMMSRLLVAAADRHCEGRVVSVLEGGYDLDALGRGVVAHVRSLGA